ncbi:MAG: response regulator [Desulfamplus sp.]|nr:response regulator [Desulfamplus sp.]
MKKKAILVVDDEKNIRLTISHALDCLKIPVETAANGEEAIQKLNTGEFEVVFLDLKMAGMNGIEILKIIRQEWPDIKVVIITAHGSISSAVEAMKIGAIDFIQKPFTPKEIREIAFNLINYNQLDLYGVKSSDEIMKSASNSKLQADAYCLDYFELIKIAIEKIESKKFNNARYILSRAIALNPGRPEAYNLIGALLEINHEPLEAQKFYRAALDINPTYKPAWFNIERITSFDKHGDIDFGKNI